ncbi:unnamed protein product [Rotaria socialis]|uniref:MULE transposase domain-containing protein n=1 Tax=Rotaria socialis TaxID=392032 RepID=A0A818NBI4_9BILA|nr:unnamed protein product [Rotaria socialis]
MSIVKSSKNKDQLLLDGFRYRRDRKSQTIWRCCRNDCGGRASFDGAIYIKVNDHIHAPNPEETIATEYKSKFVNSAITSHDPPRRIIHEVLLGISKEDGTAVPNYSSSQRTIQRKRKKKEMPLPRPKSFDEIHIPDELRVTNGGNRFLLYDNESSTNRMIILSSDDDLDRLSNSEFWHADGTFKIAPHLFYQLYTIHGVICGRALPSVYCIISGKSEEIYGEIIDVVMQHISQRPISITTDYEKAVHNVIKKKLPMATVQGCFFHFKQCLWRQINSHGLQKLFVDDRQVRRYLKNFGCLALIPEQFVIEEFEKLQVDSPDSLDDFVDYYEDNFIAIWSCFSRLDNQLPRTNNSNEDWHRAVQHSVRLNPSIYESIKDLQMEQHATLVMAEQLQAGLVKKVKRVKYELLDEQLQQLASSFDLIPRDLYFKRARALFNF